MNIHQTPILFLKAPNVGVLIIRIGFGGILYLISNKESLNPVPIIKALTLPCFWLTCVEDLELQTSRGQRAQDSRGFRVKFVKGF